MASLGTTPKQYAKTNIKIPQIVRWRMAGITDTKIAELLHMSPGGLAAIVASPEYKEYESAYLDMHLGAMDEALAGNIKEIRNQFRVAVPAAMRALVDAVTQRKDLKTALVAAKEILDRDPDKTLVAVETGDGATAIPEEVLNDAVKAGNVTAQTYVDKTKVN